LVVVKHSCQLSGISKLAITKLDVLNGLKKLKICIGYELNGEMTYNYPFDVEDVIDCRPVYKEFEGWSDLKGVDDFSSLPQKAKDYLLFIQEYLKVPLWSVSIGPERNETILV